MFSVFLDVLSFLLFFWYFCVLYFFWWRGKILCLPHHFLFCDLLLPALVGQVGEIHLVLMPQKAVFSHWALVPMLTPGSQGISPILMLLGAIPQHIILCLLPICLPKLISLVVEFLSILHCLPLVTGCLTLRTHLLLLWGLRMIKIAPVLTVENTIGTIST